MWKSRYTYFGSCQNRLNGSKNRKTVEKSVNRNFCKKAELMVKYNKRHNKFLFPALAEAIYGSSCKAENEISNVVNYIYLYYTPIKIL